jgi:phage terminase Nu1 subunit (DNA packaging protein)
VLAAIRDKRLVDSVTRNGKSYAIDAELADREWNKNTDNGRGYPAQVRHVESKIAEAAVDAGDDDQPISYAAARAQHERFKARLAQLELEEREGKLVEAEAAKREAFRVARLVRDAMLNIPDRVAAELAAETNQFKVHQRLTHEIRRALEDMKLE